MFAARKHIVIVVLAGGITDDNQLPQSVKDRIHLAKVLFKKKWANAILMSGKWSIYREFFQRPAITEAQAMVEYAQKIGLPKSVLLKEEQSRSTMENIQQVGAFLLRQKRWRKVVLVTSDFHLKRVKQLVRTKWGNTYRVGYVGAHTPATVVRRWQWKLGEIIRLYQQRFLQYFM